MKNSFCDVISCNDLGSASAERAGQGEVSGCTQRVQTAWASLGPALEMPWLALCGPLLSSCAQTSCTVPISSKEAFILVWVSSCQLSAVTIAGSLMSGCSSSHKHVEIALRAFLWSLGAENPTELGECKFNLCIG